MDVVYLMKLMLLGCLRRQWAAAFRNSNNATLPQPHESHNRNVQGISTHVHDDIKHSLNNIEFEL